MDEEHGGGEEQFNAGDGSASSLPAKVQGSRTAMNTSSSSLQQFRKRVAETLAQKIVRNPLLSGLLLCLIMTLVVLLLLLAFDVQDTYSSDVSTIASHNEAIGEYIRAVDSDLVRRYFSDLVNI